VGIAVVVHIGLGLTVVRAGRNPPQPPKPKQVLLQFEKRPETPPAPPSTPKVAAAPVPRAPAARRLAMRTRPASAPTPARSASPPPAAAPAAQPAAPVYAVAMASPTGTGPAVAVPQGVPGGTGHGPGVPGGKGAASSGTGDGFKPASARDVGSMPEVDTDACGRAAVYPREAEQSGAEGDVRLRVALNERGQVHAVRVVSGLGHGLDAAAVDAVRNRCRFKPAISREGQPVAFVIESYTFHFELPR
jgi:protein TonB